MKALITRPQPDAGAFAAECRAADVEPIVAPLMEMVFLDAIVAIENAGALAFTSANGVRAFARQSGLRDWPVFAVGEASAAAAREAGFETVHAAGGDVQSLAAFIAAEKETLRGDVLHIAGTHLAGDLAALLKAAGVGARRATLYEMRAVPVLPDAAREAIVGPSPADWAAFFSPRTAALFVELVEAAGLERQLKTIVAACLSDAVADAARALPWKDVRVASRRDAGAMIALMAAPA